MKCTKGSPAKHTLIAAMTNENNCTCKTHIRRSEQGLGKYNRSIATHQANFFHLNELWHTQMDLLTPIGFLTAHIFVRAIDGDKETQPAITMGFSL